MTFGVNLSGTSADNTMSGTVYGDTLYGGGGNDTLSSGDGNDLVYGGSGNDVLTYGEGRDTVYGGDGDDRIDDAPGVDGTVTGSLLFGDAGNDTVNGGAGFDTIDGGTGNDLLSGDGGDDGISGNAGDDTLSGGAGQDVLRGGAGNDLFEGGTGNDTLYGDSGAVDLVVNGSFEAGAPAGAVQVAMQTGWQSVSGSLATATGGAAGPAAAEGATFVSIDSGIGVDSIWQDVRTEVGKTYTLTFSAYQGAGGCDALPVHWNGVQVGCFVPSGTGWQTYSLTVTGTGGADRLSFGELALQNNGAGVLLDNVRLVSAAAGVDGDDLLAGGAGNDVLHGEGGSDRLDGGEGVDSLFGGAGDDRFVVGSIDNSVTVSNALVGATGTVRQVNESVAGFQSAPKMVVLADGRVLYVWADNGLHDDTVSMTLQGRIFDADGTAATSQFALHGLVAIDGFDGYDWDNLDLDLLPDGRVMVSYVRNTVAGNDLDEPVFSILRPTATGLVTEVANREIQAVDTPHTFESPPLTTALADGNVLFVWSENAPFDDIRSMALQGRIYNPVTDTFVTGDFRIGTVAVDGSDGFDNDSLSVIQLGNGNIVVGWIRNNSEVGFAEPVYTLLDRNGVTIHTTAEIEGTDTEFQWTPWESPPLMAALEDGRWIAVWVNDGWSDDVATMTMEARIFNADGTPATDDFTISSQAVDGSNFDWKSLTITLLPGGRVVVGYPEGYVTGGTVMPEFVIVDTATATVVAKATIPLSTTHPWPGPPLIAALGDSGTFVAVFAEGDAFSGGPTGLNYRIFDSNGNALTGQIAVLGAHVAASVSGLDGFDWDNVQVIYNAATDVFTIGWVGQNDGSGTGVFTTGPISVQSVLTQRTDVELVLGGETGEIEGDLLDLGTMVEAVTVAMTGAEAGRVTANGAILDFAEIERFRLGLGNDRFIGGIAADSVLGGAGNDTLSGADGADTLAGEAGNDLLILGAGDLASGGAGNDRFVIDLGQTGAGTLVIDGGDGTDTLDLSNVTGAGVVYAGGSTTSGTGQYVTATGQTVTIVFSGIETVILSGGPVDGTPDADLILGGYIDADGDQIDGTDGLNDTVLGGAGDDTINAGGGNDLVFGGDGDDVMVLSAAFGADTLSGGDDGQFAGDTLDASALGAVTVIYDAAGSGLLTAAAGSAAFDGIEALILGAGDDTVVGWTGADFILAGDGDDLVVSTLTGFGSPDSGIFGILDDDPDPFDDSDVVFGGQGNDTILTGDDGDIVFGDAGDDLIDGGIDADALFGNDGDDTIFGSDGSDQIFGGDGGDYLSGGSADGIDPFAEDNATDIAPFNNADEIYGGAGNDTLIGGDDQDILNGGEGDDLLFGGLDGDTLTGGVGSNTVYGGAGADVFVFTPGEQLLVADFGEGSGPTDDFDVFNNDLIDLTAYYGALAQAQADLSDDGVLNQSTGDYSGFASMEGGSITLAGVSADMLTYDNTLLF